MEMNFAFLEKKQEYELFSGACIDAERILESSPVMSAVASRKALELCVKWIYSIDSALEPIGNREGLQSLLHNNGFPSLMDITLWRRLQHIVRNGNESVHTSKRLTRDNAVLSLNILFDFVEWVDYCYGRDYVERVFDEKKIPDATTDMNVVQEEYRQVIKDVQKNADKIVNEKDKEIERLLALNKELRNEMKVQKARNIKNREYVYEPDLSEWTTRKRYIDADLEANGYVFDQDKKRNCVEVEYPVVGMPNQTGRGYVDYVIWGDTGKIIAVVEAKKASESGDKGRNQGKLYADCIQNMQGKRPIIFYTNGFETYLWDDANSAPRLVSGIFPQKDINAMIERRCIKKSVNSIQIDKQITDRWYQLRAVTKCCENYEKGIRKCLLVMATGTGKTRTATSIVDVMTRSELMGKVLFLADRKELVKQAKDAFYKYIENTTMCNLLLNKDERNAKIIFSTYQTMLHAIDTIKNADGSRFFSPGHFSLIVIDEAHRSIFNKYKAIFQYFDACLLGLTATPKNTIHQSTYTFFDMKNNIPTDVYEYEEAVEKDHVLVPFYLIETSTQISDDGITYADLDEEEREAYEAEFVEDGGVPEHIPPERINKYIFNVDTVDRMISDLMNNGIRHKNGRVEVRLELRYVERYKERKQYECLEEIHKEEIIDHLAKLVVSDEKDEAAISFDVLMYGLMLSVMTGGKNLGRLKRYVVGNANILLKECATIPDIKVRISELKELVSDHYWDVQDVLKFEETRKSLREIMKYIPAKKEKLHYSNFKDIVVFREEGRLTSLSASDFEDYRAKVNEYVEAHKTTPAINKLLHNEPISVEDYNELERIFTVELGTAEDYEMNYQDTPFGLLIRKIAKMDRTAAYAAFSTFILEERPNTEQLHFIEQVVDYVVENGYINNVLDLMKTPFDRPYKFSLIFTYEEQVKFVKIINNIKNNALVT